MRDYSKVFIIAEVSANHNGDIDRAKEIICAARDSGADAVKVQTYTADTMTIDCDNKYFQVTGGTLWDGRSLYNLYQEAYTPWVWQKELKLFAEEMGLVFFSTPFDASAVDFLEDIDVELYKVASFEVVDIPLLEIIASTGKPVIMSTGMASKDEIEEAVSALRNNGCPEIALLKCVSSYPARAENMNLATIKDLSHTFKCVSGVSDHSLDIAVPVTAVALGAKIIEKHFTLARSDGGPDAGFSLEPDEFKKMVAAVRSAEKAIGKVSYEHSESEQASKSFRRSLFVTEDIKAGEPFTEENIRSIRPGYGMKPKYYRDVLGKCAVADIKRGTPLKPELIKNFNIG